MERAKEGNPYAQYIVKHIARCKCFMKWVRSKEKNKGEDWVV